MNSIVSVIICTHNKKSLVTRAIESALSQEDCNLEVLVVDDCSQDGTYETLDDKYAGKIKLLSTEKNSGRAIATNVGYECAKGDYIALLDDDDYWVDHHKTRKQLDVMKSRPTLGVLGTWWVELKGNGVRDEKRPVPPKSRYLLVERLLAGGGIISGSSPLISREAWDKVGGVDVKQVKGMDSDLYRRIALAGYDVDVLGEVTTCADVSHEFQRMTPTTDIKGKKKQLQGDIQVLVKHSFMYLIYPRAFLLRLHKIVVAWFALFKTRFK